MMDTSSFSGQWVLVTGSGGTVRFLRFTRRGQVQIDKRKFKRKIVSRNGKLPLAREVLDVS